MKIKILKYDNPSEAAKSIAMLDSVDSIPDEKKLSDARIVRHIANSSAKRSNNLEDRVKYKKVVSIYTSYIIRLERKLKRKGR